MRNAGALNRLGAGGRGFVLFGIMLLASACTAALPVPTRQANDNPDDFRLQHPISVESTIATLNLPGGSGEALLMDTEISRLDSFFRGYQARGRGKLSIVVPGSESGQERALARGKQIAGHAAVRGLRTDEIILSVNTASDNSGRAAITVNYESFIIRASECSDWSEESSLDYSNTVYSNFGCANQRNVAFMIANPADMATPRAADPHDTARSNMVVQQYREGESTLADRSASESAAITQFAQ